MAGGRVFFYNCFFWDHELLTPLTDRIRFGDDLFVSDLYVCRCDLYVSMTYVHNEEYDIPCIPCRCWQERLTSPVVYGSVPPILERIKDLV